MRLGRKLWCKTCHRASEGRPGHEASGGRWRCQNVPTEAEPEEIRCPLCNADARLKDSCTGCGGRGVREVVGCRRVWAGDGPQAVTIMGRAREGGPWPATGGQGEQTPMALEVMDFLEGELSSPGGDGEED